MKAGKSNGNAIRWQYIIFKYNENDVPEAVELARKHQIPLQENKSSRWSGPDDPYKPSEMNCA